MKIAIVVKYCTETDDTFNVGFTGQVFDIYNVKLYTFSLKITSDL